ncbi:MAG: peptidoglycan-binding protein [Thermoanaerobaculia bacterium]|nr:peptidoglycan-binding protein [Thermoanaerobaculia bacterium]
MESRSLMLWGALTILSTSAVFAHGGGLDRNGCHTNRKTGDYHCHGAPGPPPPPARKDPAPRPATTPPPQARGLVISGGEGRGPVTIHDTGSQMGSVSERDLVLSVQLLLKALGYGPEQSDGVLSAETAAAIKGFQADALIEIDGVVSSRLLVKLAGEVARRHSTSNDPGH